MRTQDTSKDMVILYQVCLKEATQVAIIGERLKGKTEDEICNYITSIAYLMTKYSKKRIDQLKKGL